MAIDRELDQASAAHNTASDILSALPEIIASEREKTGMSQRQLARKCNFQRTYISKLENGHLEPTFRSLFRIAEGLRMTVSDLLELAQQRNPAVVERRREIGRALGTIPPPENLEVSRNGHV